MPTFTYTPIVAEAHTSPYKIHKYFARRPHNVFKQLINNYTDENEIILDPFCGGGVTVYEGISNKRKVIGCDLNPLSIFIVKNMVKKPCLNGVFNDVMQEIRNYIINLQEKFLIFNKDNGTYGIDWAEMALTVRCPYCGRPTTLSNSLKEKIGRYHCANTFCSAHDKDVIEINSCERSTPQYVYLINDRAKVRTVKEFDKDDLNRYEEHIMFLKKEMIRCDIVVPQDTIPINWDRQFEDGLAKKGILYFQDFFTKRNLYILLLVKNKIESFKDSLGEELYELVRIVFSNVLKDTNIMSFTNDGWQSGKPTTWSKHAYWIPNQFCEVSILPSFDKSLHRVVSSVKYNQEKDYIPAYAHHFDELKNNNFLLFNSSVAHANIPENSIDAIITDPPYGSNVQYLELSHFWYPWNKDLYERYPVFEIEAVANRKKGFKGAKSQYDYENNLFPVFEKAYSCLKNNRYMTLTFNNKDMSAWLALLFSIFKAGFAFHNIYFQDGVKNYKQTAHTKSEGSPYGDYIYVFKKTNIEANNIVYNSEDKFKQDLDRLFTRFLDNSEDRNTTILDMFKEAIPYIESFSKTYLNKGNKHILYKFFNKNYLDKLYKKEKNENKRR